MVVNYKFENNAVKYEDNGWCPVCNGPNNITAEEFIGYTLMECKTKCSKCGHENFWAHGFFQYPYEEDITLKKEEDEIDGRN